MSRGTAAYSPGPSDSPDGSDVKQSRKEQVNSSDSSDEFSIDSTPYVGVDVTPYEVLLDEDTKVRTYVQMNTPY